MASVALLAYVALNLRLALGAVSPVIGAIERQTGLSAGGAGLLTTTPVVCFGAFAFLTSWLINRFGIDRLIGLTMLAVAAGCALRVVPSLAGLFAGTLVIGAAIAVANVALPGIIKRDFPRNPGPVTGAYTMALSSGAAIAAGTSVPIGELTGFGWRPVLGLWGGGGGPAVLALGWWIWRTRSRPRAHSLERPAASIGSSTLSRDRVAWAVTAFMGLQAVGFYATLAWTPTLFSDSGMSVTQAGWMLSVAAVPAVLASLLAPLIERRLHREWTLVVAAGVLGVVAYLGLAFDPVPGAYVWMVCLGASQGTAIALALNYIVARASSPDQTARLSTMAQGCGYLVASPAPLLIGLIHDAAGGWSVPMLVLLAVLVPQVLSGVAASRDRYVLGGDECS